jgi:integral membrane protein
VSPNVTPRQLFRALALAEAVTWTLLLLGMVGKYVLDLTDLGVRIGGGVHGFVFLAYCATTVLVAVDRRWPVGRLLAGVGSAFVPYLTIPFERSAERAGLLGEHWRLHGERASRPDEHLAAWALRRPVLAGAVVLVLLGAVFGGLLSLGPPTEWAS